jgi:2-polyprenyl-6-hydroxyphenyl methylase/3-demethylubiquinone-9 3-methyltransferase
MFKLLRSRKLSQEEIFASFKWWDKSCLLLQITKERCDYIESRVNRFFGARALHQQEVLEVGCGGGLISEELAKRGAIVVGLDPSQKALETARKHAQQSGLGQNTYFEEGYGESLPYADGSFSVIVCVDVLEHVSNLKATVREIARVLAPGGIFIFDTINRTLLARITLIWIGEHFLRSGGLMPGLHEYSKFIKPEELRTRLIENNLQVRELTGFIPGIFHGRLVLKPGWFTGVSYVGYATKDR